MINNRWYSQISTQDSCERCGGMHKTTDSICPWHPERKPKSVLETISDAGLLLIVDALMKELEQRRNG
jgi:hypothetical protein